MKGIVKILTVLLLSVTIALGVTIADAQAYELLGPTTQRLADNQVGRAHNAGIVDEEVTLGTGQKFTQHFHCNGWEETPRTFTSLTGTFFEFRDNAVAPVQAGRYHYTITNDGGSWDHEPPLGRHAMEERTRAKLEALIMN